MNAGRDEAEYSQGSEPDGEPSCCLSLGGVALATTLAQTFSSDTSKDLKLLNFSSCLNPYRRVHQPTMKMNSSAQTCVMVVVLAALSLGAAQAASGELISVLDACKREVGMAGWPPKLPQGSLHLKFSVRTWCFLPTAAFCLVLILMFVASAVSCRGMLRQS